MGNIRLGQTVFEVKDYLLAIFTSPFLLYAGHELHAERISVANKEWCVIISVLNKPGTYTKHVSSNEAIAAAGVDPKYPEWRVDYEEDNEIARGKSAENVCVTGVVFLRKSYYDKMRTGKIACDEVLRLIQENFN